MDPRTEFSAGSEPDYIALCAVGKREDEPMPPPIPTTTIISTHETRATTKNNSTDTHRNNNITKSIQYSCTGVDPEHELN